MSVVGTSKTFVVVANDGGQVTVFDVTGSPDTVIEPDQPAIYTGNDLTAATAAIKANL